MISNVCGTEIVEAESMTLRYIKSREGSSVVKMYSPCQEHPKDKTDGLCWCGLTKRISQHTESDQGVVV